MGKRKSPEKPKDNIIRFRLEGDDHVYEINESKLTFGELSEVEQRFGCGYHEIDYASQRYMAFLLELAVARRHGPKAAAIIAQLTPSEVDFLEAEDDEGGGDRPTKTRASSGTKG